MDRFKEEILKQIINNIEKYNFDSEIKNIVFFLKKQINKEDLLYLLNDKIYSEKIINLHLKALSKKEKDLSSGIWQSRAFIFTKAYIEDVFKLPSSVLNDNIFSVIKMGINLENVIEISNYIENKGIKSSIKNYLNTLPAYGICEIIPFENHGYMSMQYIQYFDEISSIYNLSQSPTPKGMGLKKSTT